MNNLPSKLFNPLLKTLPLLALFVAALISTTGCGASSTTTRTLALPANFDQTQPVFIDINLFRGNVIVAEDPSLTNIQIKRSFHSRTNPWRVDQNLDINDDLKHSIDFIDYQAYLTRTTSGQPACVVTASTAYPYPDEQWVNVDVIAPKILGLNIQTTDGDITAANITAPFNISNNHGNIIVSTTHPIADKINLITADGHIDLRISTRSTGSINITAVNGRAAIDAPTNTPFKIRHPDPQHAYATLNPGPNAMILQTTSGNARVIITENPAKISPVKKLSLPVRP